MKRYLFPLLLFFSLRVGAQTPIPGNRLIEQRLPACFNDLRKCNCIQQFYQDKKGFIWLATPLGLIRFDGYDFKYFKNDPGNDKTIAHNYVLKLAEDKNGNIWAGLNQKGISSYNPVSNEFTNYHASSVDSSSQGAIVSIFIDESDEVWFSAGYAGISHLHKEKKTFDTYKIVTPENCPHLTEASLRLSNYAMDIKARDNYSLWLGTPEGLFIFDKATGTCTPVRAKPVDSSKPADYNARKIIKDGDLLWIGGWASGMQSYDNKTGKWEQYFFSKINTGVYTDNIVIDMAEKSREEIWVTTPDRGLGIFNKRTKSTFFFADDDHFNFLPERFAYIIFQDRQQNIWVTFDKAFYKFSLEPELIEAFKINSYQSRNNGTSMTNVVFEDSSGRYVLAGTSYSDGIVFTDRKLKKTSVISVSVHPDDIGHVLGFIQENNESVWVLTSEFLLKLNLETKQISKPVQLATAKSDWGTGRYSSFVLDENKNLWISTPVNGIICYNTETGSSKVYSADNKDRNVNIAANTINCIGYDQKSRLWYGSRLSSCYGYYDTKTKENVLLDENGHATNKTHSVKAYDFLNRGGNIYACTASGLLEFDCSGEQPALRSKINSDNGIGADWVKGAAIDRSENLWLLTLFGLCRYNPATKSLIIIDKSNGLNDDIGGISYTIRKNIYLTGTNHYYRIIEDVKPVVSDPVTPVITGLKIDENEVNVNSTLHTKREVSIPARYSYFSFLYASPDMVNADRTNYSYMLEGYDVGWIEAGNRRFANYTNLPGGNYIFKVRSSFGKEKNYSSIVGVPVFIGTLYYRTFWFRAIVISIVALILYSIYRYRVYKQQEINNLNNHAQLLEKEKTLVQYENLKQQLNPHFLFNSLAALGSLISTEPVIARTYLDQMSKIYRYILRNSNNELVPLSDEITFAATYVKLQETRFSTGLVVNIRLSEDCDYRKIVPVTIQNMIENAIKHNIISAESPLVIEIADENEYLVVKNNLQKKMSVETSNKHGLNQLKALYQYLSDKPIIIEETEKYFAIKIPLV